MAKKSLQQEIKNIIDEGWVGALYFTTALNMLKERMELMPDDAIRAMFGGLIHPDTVREHIEHIHTRLNNIR